MLLKYTQSGANRYFLVLFRFIVNAPCFIFYLDVLCTNDISISCRDTNFSWMWNRNKVVWWQKCLCRNVFIRMLWLCGGGGALLLCRAMCSLLFPDYLRHTVICAQLLCSRALLHIISAITARMYFNIILLFQFVEAGLCGFVQNIH